MTDTSARIRIPDAFVHAKIAGVFASASVLPAPPVSAIADKTSSQRSPMLDATRFIAAMGVVWVHSITPGSPTELTHGLGTFGVPFYIFAAAYFMARGFYRERTKSLGGYVVNRFHRVYLPFLAWCAVYLGMTNLIAMVSADHPHEFPHWFELYVGTKNHLWFLPYVMALCLVGAVLIKSLQKLPALRWPAVVALALAGVCSLFLPRPDWVTLNPNHPMYGASDFWIPFFRILPVPFWALAFAIAWAPGNRKLTTTTPVALIGVAVLVFSIAMQWKVGLFLTPFEDMSRQQIILERLLRGGAGIGCMLMATAPWRGVALSLLGSLGRYSYGIYLSHILVLRLITFKLDHLLAGKPIQHDLVAFALALPVSTLLSVALTRLRFTRWMTGE